MSESGFDYWTFFAEDAKRSGSLLYSRLARGVGNDDVLKEISSRAQRGQPLANLLFAAVHFLLLRGASHPLRRFYATLGGSVRAEDEDPFPPFRDFVLAHRGAIEAMVASRITNTNEVGRSAILHAGFRVLAQQAGEPLHLIEIGPSAGLNMVWDRYCVRLLKDGATLAQFGRASPLSVDATLNGVHVPPVSPTPRVGRRVGLERNPVDLSDPGARDWLRALIWPDQASRLVRLDRAIALFSQDPPEIRAGDALDLLPDTLAEVPRGEAACVYHTITTYQFSGEMKQVLEDLLTVAGLRRPVWRLSFEYDGTDYALSLIRYADGVRAEQALARCHPHGTWIEWRQSAESALP